MLGGEARGFTGDDWRGWSQARGARVRDGLVEDKADGAEAEAEEAREKHEGRER